VLIERLLEERIAEDHRSIETALILRLCQRFAAIWTGLKFSGPDEGDHISRASKLHAEQSRRAGAGAVAALRRKKIRQAGRHVSGEAADAGQEEKEENGGC